MIPLSTEKATEMSLFLSPSLPLDANKGILGSHLASPQSKPEKKNRETKRELLMKPINLRICLTLYPAGEIAT